jgi:hypothetical protein
MFLSERPPDGIHTRIVQQVADFEVESAVAPRIAPFGRLIRGHPVERWKRRRQTFVDVWRQCVPDDDVRKRIDQDIA